MQTHKLLSKLLGNFKKNTNKIEESLKNPQIMHNYDY